jgi:hypothetical protein
MKNEESLDMQPNRYFLEFRREDFTNLQARE